MRRLGERLSLTLPIALVILLTALPISSEAQSADSSTNTTQDLSNLNVYLGMHTINFTQILGMFANRSTGGAVYNVPGNLSVFSAKILEALRNVTTGCETLSCLAQNRTAMTMIERGVSELERIGYLDPAAASEILSSINQMYLNDEALRSIVGDQEVMKLITNITSSGAQSYSEALGVLDSLFRGGRISLNEYIAALELLKRISLRQGLEDQAIAIDRMQLEVIKQLILSNTAEGLVKSLTSILASTRSSASTQQSSAGESRISYLFAAPSNVYMPAPSSISRLDLFTLALIVICVSAITIIAIIGMPSTITRILRSRASEREPGFREPSLRSVIGIYWGAVSILSRRIPRSPSETHREYLEKVRGRVGYIEPFEDLTKIYEGVRYAHEPEERYLERAFRDYEELERS